MTAYSLLNPGDHTQGRRRIRVLCIAAWLCMCLTSFLFTTTQPHNNQYDAYSSYYYYYYHTTIRSECMLALARAIVFAAMEFLFTACDGALFINLFNCSLERGQTSVEQFVLNMAFTIFPGMIYHIILWPIGFGWYILFAPLLYWTCEATQGYCVMALSRDGSNMIWSYPREKWFVLCHGNIRLDYFYYWWLCGAIEYSVRVAFW